jgi:type VI secretion system secreted protein Hcp
MGSSVSRPEPAVNTLSFISRLAKGLTIFLEVSAMAFDTYLYFEGGAQPAEGETTDSVYKANKAMEIYSFSIGASNPSTIGSGSGGGAGGRVSVSSFNAMKKTDKASCALFAACCQGDHFDKATVVLRKAGGKSNKQMPFLTYTFEEVYIDSIQWSGSTGGDDTPTESISFSFGKVGMVYGIQAPDGSVTPGNNASWDLRTNTP